LVFVFWQTAKARAEKSRRAAVYAGIAALLLTNIHTYDAIPLNTVLLLWALGSTPVFRRMLKQTTDTNRWLSLAPLSVIFWTLPPLLYQFFVFRNSTEFQVKALTRTAAPPLMDIVLSYGPLMALAIAGGFIALRVSSSRLPIAWALITLMMIYAPVSFARKMIEGLHLPLCFLAALAISALLAKLASSSTRKIVAGATVAVLSISSLQFVAWSLENARDNNLSRAQVFMPPLSLTSGDAAALTFLNESKDGRDGAVLALPYLSNYIPRETGRTVYAGHWAETLNFFDEKTRSGKIVEVQRFFGLSGTMTSDEAKQWLAQNHIRYIVMGFYENELRARLPLDLPLLHEQNGTRVYKVP
ncbi:MAG TPA: hypothetical protein VF719_00755, partial [Abditibacteriaceae bacterium]